MKNKYYLILFFLSLFNFSSLAQEPKNRCLNDSSVYIKYDRSLLQLQLDQYMMNFDYDLTDSLSDGLWILFEECENTYSRSKDTLCYGNYKNGFRQGEFKYFNHSGFKVVNYLNGEKNGRSFTKINGQISQEIFYVKGKKNGPLISYQNGLLENVSFYANDSSHYSATFDYLGELKSLEFKGDSTYWFGETGIFRKAYFDNYVLKRYVIYFQNGKIAQEVEGDFLNPGDIGRSEDSTNQISPSFILKDLIKGSWKVFNDKGELIDEGWK